MWPLPIPPRLQVGLLTDHFSQLESTRASHLHGSTVCQIVPPVRVLQSPGKPCRYGASLLRMVHLLLLAASSFGTAPASVRNLASQQYPPLARPLLHPLETPLDRCLVPSKRPLVASLLFLVPPPSPALPLSAVTLREWCMQWPKVRLVDSRVNGLSASKAFDVTSEVLFFPLACPWMSKNDSPGHISGMWHAFLQEGSLSTLGLLIAIIVDQGNVLPCNPDIRF